MTGILPGGAAAEPGRMLAPVLRWRTMLLKPSPDARWRRADSIRMAIGTCSMLPAAFATLTEALPIPDCVHLCGCLGAVSCAS